MKIRVLALCFLSLLPSCTVIETCGEIGGSICRTISERASVRTNIPYNSLTLQIVNLSDFYAFGAKDLQIMPSNPISLFEACEDGYVFAPHSAGGFYLSNFGRRSSAQYAVSLIAFDENNGSVIGNASDVLSVSGRHKQALVWTLYNCSFGQPCSTPHDGCHLQGAPSAPRKHVDRDNCPPPHIHLRHDHECDPPDCHD